MPMLLITAARHCSLRTQHVSSHLVLGRSSALWVTCPAQEHSNSHAKSKSVAGDGQTLFEVDYTKPNTLANAIRGMLEAVTCRHRRTHRCSAGPQACTAAEPHNQPSHTGGRHWVFVGGPWLSGVSQTAVCQSLACAGCLHRVIKPVCDPLPKAVLRVLHMRAQHTGRY
jgi:hypothetical protein